MSKSTKNISEQFQELTDNHQREYESFTKLKGFPNNLSKKNQQKLNEFFDRKKTEELEFHTRFDPETVKECKNPSELAEWIQRELEYVEDVFSNPYIPDNEERLKEKYRQITERVEEIAPRFKVDINTNAKTIKAHLEIICNRCIDTQEQDKPAGGDEGKLVSLREYLEEYTYVKEGVVDSKIKRIKAVNKRDNLLPEPANKPKGNQTKLYLLSELNSVWYKLKCQIPTLPNKKS